MYIIIGKKQNRSVFICSQKMISAYNSLKIFCEYLNVLLLVQMILSIFVTHRPQALKICDRKIEFQEEKDEIDNDLLYRKG